MKGFTHILTRTLNRRIEQPGEAAPPEFAVHKHSRVRRRMALALGALMLVSLAIATYTVHHLYGIAFDEQHERLVDSVRNNKHLIDSMVRYGAVQAPDGSEGSMAETIAQLADTYSQIEGSDETGEVILGARRGEEVELLVIQRDKDLGERPVNSIRAGLAEPMQRALAGKSGSMVGRDYAGKLVLAAYEPLGLADLGLVAKAPLAELRAPYFRAWFIAVALSFVPVLLGFTIVIWFGRPIVQQIEESEQRFQRAVDGTDDGLLEWNVRTNEMWVSRRSLELIGHDDGTIEPSFEAYFALIHPEDQPAMDEAIRRHLEAQRPFDVECRLQTRNRGTRWFRIRANALRDRAGNPLLMAGSIQDIHEQKLARDELATQNDLALLTAAISLSLTSGQDMKTVLQRCTEAVMRYVPGSAFARIWTLNETDDVLELQASAGLYTHIDGGHARVPVGQFKIGRIAESGQAHRTNDVPHDPHVGDQEWARREGLVAFAGQPLIVNGRVIGVLALFAYEELTDAALRTISSIADSIALGVQRTRAEEQREKSKRLFESIIERLSEGIIVVDRHAKAVHANKAARRLATTTAFDHDPSSWPEAFGLFTPDGSRLLREDELTVMRALKGETVDNFEYLSRSKAHKVDAIMSASSFPLLDADGTVEKAVVVFRDITIYREAEQVRRRANEFLRNVIDSLPEHIAVLDDEGKITLCNEAWCRFSRLNGGRQDGYIGTDYISLCRNAVAEDDEIASDVSRAIEGVLAGERNYFECVYPCHGTTTQNWFEMRVAPHVHEGRRGAVVAHINITARVLAEQALRQRESLISNVIENIPNSVFWKDRESRFLGCNVEFARQVGAASPADVVGKTDYDLVDSREAADAFRWTDRQIIERGKPLLNIEEPVHLHDRHATLLTSKVPLRNDDGEITGILGIFADITSLKENEQRLRLQSTALNAAANAIVITRADGIIIWANPAFERLTGYSADEMLGKPTSLLRSGKHDPEFYRRLWDTIKTGKTWSGEVINRRKNGTLYTEEMTITPVYEEGKEPTHFIAIKQDITDRKRMEQVRLRALGFKSERKSLIRAKRAAEAASKAKSDFLATMSHELRTPLNGMIGMSELLLHTDLNEKQRHYAGLARQSGQALLTLINDILDFSKIEAGKLELEHIEFDLRDVVEGVVATQAPAAESRGVTATLSFHPSVPPVVQGDPARLKQILTNLINNAIKFTERGEVTVSVTLEDETDSAAAVRFTVNDSGIGIPPDRVDHLFESFTQLDSSTTRRFGGTGLGLAISKQLATLMGGTIGVESEDGVGSTFWFVVRFDKSEQSTCAPSLLPADLRQLFVLAVDDNEVNREVLRHQLNAAGIRHDVADNPADALTRLRDQARDGAPYDLAIVDMCMPNMDGIVFARELRLDPVLAKTVLLLCTSVDPQREQELRDAGFSGVLQKPLTLSRLLGAIAEACACAESKLLREQARSHPTFVDPQDKQSSSRLSGARILVVEDNEISRIAVVEMLTQLGATCQTAANGQQAVEAVAARPFDLVLMDCQMPVMDGFTATRTIRENERARAPEGAAPIPIVALTANAIKGDRERCIRAGMNDYIAKPFDVDQLERVIAKCIAGQGASAEETSTPEIADVAPNDDVANAAPFDLEAAAKRWGGDTSIVRMIVEKFCRSGLESMAKIDENLAAGNAGEVTVLAHGLKGAASYVCAHGVRAAAASLEEKGRSGDLTEARPLVEALRRELDKCVSAAPAATRCQ